MIATELRHCLHTLGLSQLDAARLLAVSPRTIRRWIEGEDVPVPAEQALRAWTSLHRRGLPWRPDEYPLTHENEEQMAVARSHTINVEALLARVEARGGPMAPWKVDLDRRSASLGHMHVSFYVMPNGGISLQSYRREDGASPDLQRDQPLLEDAVACIAQTFAAHHMSARTRLSFGVPSLNEGVLYLWETTLSPAVVVKLECQALRTVLGEPTLTDQSCRLLVESNRELLTRGAEDLYANKRVEYGPMGMRILHFGEPELRAVESAIGRGVLDIRVQWGR